MNSLIFFYKFQISTNYENSLLQLIALVQTGYYAVRRNGEIKSYRKVMKTYNFRVNSNMFKSAIRERTNVLLKFDNPYIN